MQASTPDSTSSSQDSQMHSSTSRFTDCQLYQQSTNDLTQSAEGAGGTVDGGRIDNAPSDLDAAFVGMERRARVVLERISMRDEDIEHRMPEYVQTLREYRLGCQARSMYKEAHLVQMVLRNLRLEEETRHIRGLTEQQMDERRLLEEAHRNEFREFHRQWNEKIDEFEEQQLAQEVTLLERQNEELLAFREEMREFNPRVLRYSRTLIHSRAKQQALANQKEYTKAHEEKVKADAIEQQDMKRFEQSRAAMYERREQALHHRHQQEVLALRARAESRRLLLERARKAELDVLLQRYINIRRELESQQSIMRSRAGNLLLKHACNSKSDVSGSAALVESAVSGAFGMTVKRRHEEEIRVATLAASGDSSLKGVSRSRDEMSEM